MTVPLLRVTGNGLIIDRQPLVGPFFSLWNQWPHLHGRSLVIGWIGPRGSGKGTSSARTLLLDYLLKSRRVWSRVNIAVDLWTPHGNHPLRSIPITPDFSLKDCYDGCLFMDEVNEDGADAYRSQSSEALELSYDIQELRKNDKGGLSKMDFMWAATSEMLCNPRMRMQTDILIKCFDQSIVNHRKEMGESSRWEIWDYSGIITGSGNTSRMPVTPIVFTKPWWHIFNTGERIRDKVRQEKVDSAESLYQTASKIAEFIKDNGKVRRLKVWSEFNISDHKQQIAIHRILGGDFDIVTTGNRDFYTLDKEMVEA